MALFTELAVFNARLYIRVRRLDEPGERCGVCGRSRSQFHVAHELAGALQQAGGIGQRCALKEPHIYMRSEYVDVAEGRIAQTCNGTAVMQDLPDLVPALSHNLKPLVCDGSQFTSMPIHPRVDGGISFDGTVDSQQFRSHRGFISLSDPRYVSPDAGKSETIPRFKFTSVDRDLLFIVVTPDGTGGPA